jgi:signal transduction histidine kinase
MALHFHVMVPVVGPVLTIVLSSAGIGCLYWNRERLRRRYVEALDEAKQQFTDMLVHDLKNTMAPVSMLLSSVRSKFGTTTSKDLNFWTNDFQKTVYSSTKRLTSQINALLDVRRMAEGRLQLDRRPVSLSALVKSIGKEFDVVMEQSDLKLEVRCQAPDDQFVSIDTAVFDRVVGNLMWNAVKYSRMSSTIVLGTRSDPNGRVSCFVSNDGRIIPPEEQEKLFTPFFTGNSKNRSDSLSSTGLGLTFCKLAVEAHGGTIKMISPRENQAEGVEVRVRFDVVEG